jgi:hypothetical protein
LAGKLKRIKAAGVQVNDDERAVTFACGLDGSLQGATKTYLGGSVLSGPAYLGDEEHIVYRRDDWPLHLFKPAFYFASTRQRKKVLQ